MEPIYLVKGAFDSAEVFFRTDSEQIAKRLIGLLGKKHPDQVWNLSARSPRDEDEGILFDEALTFVEQAAECTDGDFGTLPFKVSDEQKQLVAFYWACERWERAIREREAKQEPKKGPYYIARYWWDEGYSGYEAIYRVDQWDIAEELTRAANARFATSLGDILENGSCATYETMPADRVPSVIVWDEAIRQLAVAAESDKSGDAEAYAACVEWEAVIRKGQREPTASLTGPTTEHQHTSRAGATAPQPPVPRFGELSPVAVYLGAETCATIFGRLRWNHILLRKNGDCEYDRSQMNRDVKLAERHGYVVAAAARTISRDPTPITTVLTNDRLWEWPNEPADGAILHAAIDLCRQMAIDARVECAAKGLDPYAGLSVGEPNEARPPAPIQESNAEASIECNAADEVIVAAAADTFLAGIADFVACVTTAEDKRDPESLYIPVERAGYNLLRAGRGWGIRVELLDQLLRIARVEGVPHEGFGDKQAPYEVWRQQSVSQYLSALKGEVYEIRHEALLRLPTESGSLRDDLVVDPPSASKKPAISGGAPDLVTLDEAAAMVHRSKKTLERYLAKMPAPYVQGGGGKPSLWKWDELRPWLEQQFVPDLPERFPRNIR